MNVTSSRTSGFSLIEVMIAVVVLSFGLLSLAALQGELFRSGAEAKARANATAIAQQVLENSRSFAFVVAPALYTGDTYMSLATDSWAVPGVGGVDFAVNREVTRYRYDAASGKFAVGSGDFNGGVPEFKMVRATVSWSGSDAQTKSVTLTDSIAAISPADAAQLRRQQLAGQAGPQVWIEPPNKNNPQVVPIAIGDGQSAASSNPKPEQFVDDVSAATLFSVMTFSGASEDAAVRLNRKLDVAAVSCVCEEGGQSTAGQPAYQPTVWNGKQLAYAEPQTLPVGTKVGSPVLGNQDSEIESLCTVCCRDHHESANRAPKPDPYRELLAGEASGGVHYGYKSNGGSYNVGAGLLPTSETGGVYVDACQVVRVGGRMRMTVDARQNDLLVTSLNDAKTGYRLPSFSSDYAGFVTNSIADGMSALPSGYPAPGAAFPEPTAARELEYAAITNPASIALGPKPDQKTLVAFGLYVDYLSPDTIKAYECALTDNDTGDCEGLGLRSPLEVLPFFAVNVANLGSWRSSKPAVASASNVVFDNKGLLATDGGVVSALDGSSVAEFPITLSIKNSNSGLAGTAGVDKDDLLPANLASDEQLFTKADGAADISINTLTVTFGLVPTVTDQYAMSLAGRACSKQNKTNVWICDFNSPASNLALVLGSYNVVDKRTKSVTNYKVCVPVDPRVSAIVLEDGLATETTAATISTLGAQNYNMSLNVVLETEVCPAGSFS